MSHYTKVYVEYETKVMSPHFTTNAPTSKLKYSDLQSQFKRINWKHISKWERKEIENIFHLDFGLVPFIFRIFPFCDQQKLKII